jgi:hypothetical protein
MSFLARREIVYAIGSLAIIVMLIDYFLENDFIGNISSQFQTWTLVISAFALGVGAITILQRHLKNIMNRTPDTPYSATLVGSFLLMFITALFMGDILNNPSYFWVNTHLYVPIVQTMPNFLAIFILTAAYRAFRARSIEASLMLIAAVLVMLGNAPISAAIWPGFESIRSWIMNVLNAAGYRGIIIGASVGLVIMGIRVLLWIERGFYGGEAAAGEEG